VSQKIANCLINVQYYNAFDLLLKVSSRVVIDIFQQYRRYSISMPALKVSSIPISILCHKSIEIDTLILL